MTTTPPVKTKPTKAQVGLAIAAASTTLEGVQALLPVDGTVHLAIAIAIVVLGGLGTYVGVFNTTNAPVDD